jgi:hypothetical protein
VSKIKSRNLTTPKKRKLRIWEGVNWFSRKRPRMKSNRIRWFKVRRLKKGKKGSWCRNRGRIRRS